MGRHGERPRGTRTTLAQSAGATPLTVTFNDRHGPYGTRKKPEALIYRGFPAFLGRRWTACWGGVYPTILGKPCPATILEVAGNKLPPKLPPSHRGDCLAGAQPCARTRRGGRASPPGRRGRTAKVTASAREPVSRQNQGRKSLCTPIRKASLIGANYTVFAAVQPARGKVAGGPASGRAEAGRAATRLPRGPVTQAQGRCRMLQALVCSQFSRLAW